VVFVLDNYDSFTYNLVQYIGELGAQVEVRVLSPRAAELQALMPFKPPPDLSRFLLSPMPGLLVEVAVSAGQSVRAGERLAVIEAMKMEHTTSAPADGICEAFNVTVGEQVSEDAELVRFRPA